MSSFLAYARNAWNKAGSQAGNAAGKNDGHKVGDDAYGPNWPSQVPCRAERGRFLTLESEKKDSVG